MIVSCPECKARYRVRRESLAPEGSRMRCPKCTSIFLARPDAGVDDAAAPSTTATQLQRVQDAQPGSPTNPGFLDNGLGGYLDSALVHSSPSLPPVPQALPPSPTPPPMMAVNPPTPPRPRPAPPPTDDDPFANVSLDPDPQPQSGKLRAAVEAASDMQRVQLREPNGALTEFGHIGPARQWVANHPAQETLEVSVGGGAFVPVRTSPHFQDLPSATIPPAGAPARPAAGAPMATRRPTGTLSVQGMVPPPPVAPPRTRLEIVTSVAALSVTSVVAVLGIVGALWGRGVMEDSLNRLAVETLGMSSPRYSAPVDANFRADMILQEAEDDRMRGRYAHAAVGYRKVLNLRPGDEEARKGLIRAYSRLGDCGAAKAAGGPGCIPRD